MKSINERSKEITNRILYISGQSSNLDLFDIIEEIIKREFKKFETEILEKIIKFDKTENNE